MTSQIFNAEKLIKDYCLLPIPRKGEFSHSDGFFYRLAFENAFENLCKEKDEIFLSKIKEWENAGKPNNFHFMVHNDSYTIKENESGSAYDLIIVQNVGW